LAGYVVFHQFGGAVPKFPLLYSGLHSWLRVMVGGVGIGFVGAILGGCPFRMHVLAAEGKKTYWFYLLGFYAALILFTAFPVQRLMATLGR
jgi:uncharacterized membrane protein YedE/YeeE